MNIKRLASFLFVLGCVFCLTSMKNIGENFGDDIKLADLDLNRQAVSLAGNKIEEFPLAERGFLWDEEDSKTKKWRPQGITGLKEAGKEYVIISWYGRKEADDTDAKWYDNDGYKLPQERSDISAFVSVRKVLVT
jgi:hypothetical protein